MLRTLIALLLLSFTLTAPSALAEGRILVLSGYVDGLPFPRRIKQDLRDQLEAQIPGVVVHAQSLDIYRPQPESHKQLLVDVISATYAGQVDLIVALDPKAFEFYRERLSSQFGDTPIIFSNDRGELTALQAHEYSLLIRPNFRETLRIARHHYPELKRLYLVGDEYNEDLTVSELDGQLAGIELVRLGEKSLEQMRQTISSLGEGDLLFFQLLFADGEGTPMVPPIRYLTEFAALSPVPTLCMYANFIAQGCLGGSVSSPADQAQALVEAIQTYAFKEVSLDTATWSPLPQPPTGQILRRFASQSVVDYTALERFSLDQRKLAGVRYVNEPQPIYAGFAKELAILSAIALALLAATIGYLWFVRGQRNLLHRFASLSDTVPTGIFWSDESGRRWHHNQRISHWANQLNMPVGELREAALAHLSRHPHTHKEFALGKAGEIRYFNVRVTEYQDHPEILLLEETTELHEYQRKLQEQALIDELTGLPNRRSVNTTLERWCAASHREQRSFAVMLFDLDGFKSINDNYGHAAGDTVLAKISARLKSRSRQSDMISRLGGDEFLLLADGLGSDIEAQSLARALLTTIEEPIDLDEAGARVSLTASVGIALCPEHTSDPDLITLFADRAMYSVKRDGEHGGVAVYSPLSDEAEA